MTLMDIISDYLTGTVGVKKFEWIKLKEHRNGIHLYEHEGAIYLINTSFLLNRNAIFCKQLRQHRRGSDIDNAIMKEINKIKEE